MTDYYIVKDGKPSGPYPIDKLKELGVTEETFVKSAEMDDYKEAHEVPEVVAQLGFRLQTFLPQYFASLDLRLLATVIDYFIVFAVYCVLSFLLILLSSGRDARITILLAASVLIPVSKIIYSIILEASTQQATYGKRLMNLKVTDEEGKRISFSRSFLRNLMKILSLGTLGIGFLMGFFNKRQQCLHDRIAGTLVIKERLIG